MKILPKQAIRLLKRFNYDNYTIAAIAEQGAPIKAFNYEHFKSTKHGPNGKAQVAVTVDPQTFETRDFIMELGKLQKLKRAIYFMVNESDGISGSDTPNTNKVSNVLKLNACFADTDNCPVQTYVKWIKEIKILPHAVVETSPKKFHFYYLIEGTALEDQDKWKAIQKSMEWLGTPQVDTGMDKTMHDLTQLMRLPGFYHQKKKPFPIKVVKESFHKPYNLFELFEKTGAERFYTPKHEYKGFEYPSAKISAGERHEAFRNFALSMANDLIGDPNQPRKVLDAVDGHMLKVFKNPWPFLQDGKRRKEVLRTVKDACNLASKRIIETLPDVDFDEDLHTTDNFAMSPSFYYHCPGIVGEITRHICKKAMYPIPSFTFASTIALLGTLKAKHVTSNLGHAPANYFLCLAPTGAGKNYPQEVLAETFDSLGLASLASSKVRSARGIEVFLKKHSSTGTLTLDEAEGFFSSLSDHNTPSYLKQCKDVLLEIYSKTNISKYSTGQLGDIKHDPIILNRPRLNLLAYGVVHTLEEAFDQKAIADGLLQRFIILTHMGKRNMNENYQPAKALNGRYYSALKEVVLESKIMTAEIAFKIADLRKEMLEEEKDSRRSKLADRIERLENKYQDSAGVVLKFDADAQSLLLKYCKKMDKQHGRELDKKSGLEGLYTRAGEQVGRLATAICVDKTIDKQLVEYLIDFVDSRVNALSEYVRVHLGKSQYVKLKEQLLRCIQRRFKETREPVTARYVSSRALSSKSRKHFRDVLDGLYDDGSIRMIDPPSRGGRGARGETFIPLPDFEEEL